MPSPITRRAFLGSALLLAGCTVAPVTRQAPETPKPPHTPEPPEQPTTPAVETTAKNGSSIRMEALDGVPTTFGTHLPGIEDTVPRGVALTFDACGGGYDEALIAVLREHQVPATLFLAQPWIHAHPEVTRELVADPLFQIENHGTRHVPLTVAGQAAYGIHGTASAEEAVREVEENAATLREYGVNSRWFRAGTAHYDDVAVRMVRDGGGRIAGFSINGDYGATASADAVAHAVGHAPPGSIVLAHMNHPGSGTAAGVRRALEHLLHDVPLVPLR